jgi:hypothetical protein
MIFDVGCSSVFPNEIPHSTQSLKYNAGCIIE